MEPGAAPKSSNSDIDQLDAEMNSDIDEFNQEESDYDPFEDIREFNARWSRSLSFREKKKDFGQRGSVTEITFFRESLNFYFNF